jgi:hypothetical protein
LDWELTICGVHAAGAADTVAKAGAAKYTQPATIPTIKDMRRRLRLPIADPPEVETHTAPGKARRLG